MVRLKNDRLVTDCCMANAISWVVLFGFFFLVSNLIIEDLKKNEGTIVTQHPLLAW